MENHSTFNNSVVTTYTKRTSCRHPLKASIDGTSGDAGKKQSRIFKRSQFQDSTPAGIGGGGGAKDKSWRRKKSMAALENLPYLKPNKVLGAAGQIDKRKLQRQIQMAMSPSPSMIQ